MKTTPEYQEIFEVVINLEDQYSIWPKRKEVPYGWKTVGKFGPKDECLAYVKEVWTDMRPKSLKEAEAERAVESMKDVN